MKSYLYTLIIVTGSYLIMSCYSRTMNQFTSLDDMPNEPGKCYAKCLIQDVYETKVTTLPVYNGDLNTENVEVDTIQIEISPSKSKTIVTLRDTTTSDNFEYMDIMQRVLVKRGGESKWIEVVCTSKVTPAFYSKIQTALLNRGYDIGSRGANGLVTENTKAALREFQRTNGLPVGSLDVETVAALEVDFPEY